MLVKRLPVLGKQQHIMFKLGLIVNPLAGIGGPVGLKGSDGDQVVSEAMARGATRRAGERAANALRLLLPVQDLIEIYCYDGSMGGDAVAAAGLNRGANYRSLGISSEPSSREDTIAVAQQLRALNMDLIVFAGGDGTARDIVAAVGSDVPVLGIPAGVKMHSGVYTVSPEAAGQLLVRLVEGGLVDIGQAEVRDIDEEAFRQGRVQSKFYGELLVPREGRFLQQVKSSGREVEALVVQDIGADLDEDMVSDCLYLIGPGSTPSGFMEALGLDNTLLGVDAVFNRKQLGKDLNEQQILALLERYPHAQIVVTAIGGQGHIFGRGNQQLSAAVISTVGLTKIVIVATKTKITALEGRPLLVDTGDVALDRALTGYRRVVTGYHDAVMYPVSPGGDMEVE